MFLLVAVDAAHALLQASRVPRNVVIDQQPTKLQIDALAGGVGGRQDAGPIWVLEESSLALAFLVVHPTVDLGNPAGQATSFQTACQEVQRIPELSEDQHFGIRILFQGVPQSLKLALVLLIVDLAGQHCQPADLLPLGAKFRQRVGIGSRLDLLVLSLPLFQSLSRLLFVPGFRVADILLGQTALAGLQLFLGEQACLQLLDYAQELLLAALQ